MYKELLWHSRAGNRIWPEFKLNRDFMPVQVTSKFDEDPIKNKCASLETPFCHYVKAQGHRQCNYEGSGPIWLKFKLIQDFMPALITCKFDEDWIKSEGVSVETSFSPLYVNGIFLLPWQPQFSWHLLQNLKAAFPPSH